MGKELDRSNFWLIRNNPIIKTGVFPYLGRQIGPECEAEKIYNVLRPEEELFTEKAMSSFDLIPIIVGHKLLGSREEGLTPPEEKGVDGTTGESAKRQGDKLVNDIKLYSERIKDEIQNGKKELSAGYFCDFVPEQGVWQGQHYDYVQRNIGGNHIALVEKGRNGSDVRVMDSAEGLPQRAQQFCCDTLDIEGQIEQHGEADMEEHANDANWEENKHKRDEDGKFTSSGGAGSKSSGSHADKDVQTNPLNEKKFVEHLQKNGPIKKTTFKNLGELKKAVEAGGWGEIADLPEDANEIIVGNKNGGGMHSYGFSKFKDGTIRVESFQKVPNDYLHKEYGYNYVHEAEDAMWEESKHKRDSDGKFSSGGGASKSNSQSKESTGNIPASSKVSIGNVKKLRGMGHPWETGTATIGGKKYKFHRQIFNEPSMYGIENGRISKLYIQEADSGKDVVLFDRGWEVKPQSDHAKSLFKELTKDNKKAATDEDLKRKNNRVGGLDAAPEKENEMDKREAIREIMAISAKPAEEFAGGEEEKVETIGQILEKLAYKPSEGETDVDDACDADADLEDGEEAKPAGDPKEEDKKPASLDEMEKELLARMGRKDSLVKRLTPIIGAFDSALMTEKEVAAYACEKLGKKVAMDEAVNYLNGYLDAQKPAARVTFGATRKVSAAQDSALDKFLEEKK